MERWFCEREDKLLGLGFSNSRGMMGGKGKMMDERRASEL